MRYDLDTGYGAYGGPRYAGYGAYPYDRDYGWSGYDITYRRSPRESPTYGRAGDEAARRFARSHGYDVGYTIRPGRESGARFAPRDFGAGRYEPRFRGYDRGFWGSSRYGAYPDSGWGHPW